VRLGIGCLIVRIVVLIVGIHFIVEFRRIAEVCRAWLFSMLGTVPEWYFPRRYVVNGALSTELIQPRPAWRSSHTKFTELI
jgi:hypothetical protein